MDEGEPAALRAVARRHCAALFRYAFWLCGNRRTAEELVRAAFAARAPAGTAGRPSSMPDLVREVRAAHAAREVRPAGVLAGEPWDCNAADPDTRALRRAIARLPAGDREALVLQASGLSIESIARTREEATDVVEARLVRARESIARETVESPA